MAEAFETRACGAVLSVRTGWLDHPGWAIEMLARLRADHQRSCVRCAPPPIAARPRSLPLMSPLHDLPTDRWLAL